MRNVDLIRRQAPINSWMRTPPLHCLGRGQIGRRQKRLHDPRTEAAARASDSLASATCCSLRLRLGRRRPSVRTSDVAHPPRPHGRDVPPIRSPHLRVGADQQDPFAIQVHQLKRRETAVSRRSRSCAQFYLHNLSPPEQSQSSVGPVEGARTCVPSTGTPAGFPDHAYQFFAAQGLGRRRACRVRDILFHHGPVDVVGRSAAPFARSGPTIPSRT